ncbi:acyl-CoA thioesterase [Desulfobacterota bacterium AH_259_B03_O07]|nr:acyl-CoA thioesterase [Desulfobacterota bacterium AH_259_B03_O07]
MPSIKETRNQMIQFVFPEHANNLGTLHGGRVMDWIMLAASITSSRIAKGITVLGTTDSIDFFNPVRIGEIVVLDSWIEFIGNSSLELGVHVQSENTETGEMKLTTTSHLAFVAVDKDGIPRSVPNKIAPADDKEALMHLEAQNRKDSRTPEIAKRDEMARNLVDETEFTRFNLQTTKAVLPEDSFYGNFMSVGKLMLDIDETAAILAKRFVKGDIVTGSLDNLYFHAPIRVGDIIILKAGLNYVGNTSLEVGIKVLSEDLNTGDQKHTCTAFLSFVHIGKDGKTKPVPSFTPETPYEKRLWKEAEARKKRRVERVKQIKEST